MAVFFPNLDFIHRKHHLNINIGFLVRDCTYFRIALELIEEYFTELLASMTRATGKEFLFNGSFHEAFSSVLVVAQCLAILPVIGIKSGSAYGLRFTWKSYRTIYSMTAFAFAASYTIFSTYITLNRPITFNSIGSYLIL